MLSYILTHKKTTNLKQNFTSKRDLAKANQYLMDKCVISMLKARGSYFSDSYPFNASREEN